MRVQKLLDLAYDFAKQSTVNYQIGCVLTQRSRVIATGFGRVASRAPRILRKTHASAEFGYIHAEIDALLSVLPGLDAKLDSRTTAFVAGYTKGGGRAYCCPCPGCQEVLLRCGVSRVYFGTPHGFEYRKLSKERL